MPKPLWHPPWKLYRVIKDLDLVSIEINNKKHLLRFDFTRKETMTKINNNINNIDSTTTESMKACS